MNLSVSCCDVKSREGEGGSRDKIFNLTQPQLLLLSEATLPNWD
jgi:hypothetical protein